jgi:acetyl-CoA acetyltransferase
MIASPLHLLDCCLVAEGGVGIVLTTMERAHDLRHKPVAILGGGMEVIRGAYASPPLLKEVGTLGQEAIARALGTAGIEPMDLDILSLYDATSFEVIRQLEIIGLCQIGEGGPLVDTGAISLGGKFPTNPDGGALSHSWAPPGHLSQRVVEVVRQLRGTAVHQVENAEVGLAVNAGSGAQHIEVAVLARA